MHGIKKKIIKIVAKQFQKKICNLNIYNNFINDFQADSLDFVELIMLIEEKFNIELTDINIDNIVTIKNLIDYIKIKKNIK